MPLDLPVVGSDDGTWGLKLNAALTELDERLTSAEESPDGSQLASSARSGTTYTLALSDAGTVVEFTNSSAVTVTVPPNSSVAFAVGDVVNLYAAGAAGVTVAAGGGVTIRGNSTVVAQYGEVSLRKRATNEWVRVG